MFAPVPLLALEGCGNGSSGDASSADMTNGVAVAIAVIGVVTNPGQIVVTFTPLRRSAIRSPSM